MKIDNFALQTFQDCPWKYNLRIKKGWTPRAKSAPLGFGSCMHEGLAAWYKTGSKAAALAAIEESWPLGMPSEDYRNKTKAVSVMLDYTKKYAAEGFSVVGAPDNPMIEKAFTLDTGMFLSCIKCGPVAGAWDMEHGDTCPNCEEPLEPIEYGGIVDGIVEFSGKVYILEHKTTSQLGSQYFYQFHPNNQVTGYIWGARGMSGRRVGGAIINAIGVYKASPTKFEREITTRSDSELEEWLENIRCSAELLWQCEREDTWPTHSRMCTMYGRCEFHSVCVLAEPADREKMLQSAYRLERWDHEDR